MLFTPLVLWPSYMYYSNCCHWLTLLENYIFNKELYLSAGVFSEMLQISVVELKWMKTLCCQIWNALYEWRCVEELFNVNEERILCVKTYEILNDLIREELSVCYWLHVLLLLDITDYWNWQIRKRMICVIVTWPILW